MPDLSHFAQEFPQDADLVYLNHAAVAPWPARTRDAVIRFSEENSRFGAKNYPEWSKKENELRNQLAELVNAAHSSEISLLKNTSEAISVVASGIRWKAGDNIVITNEEFPSNRIPWEAQKEKGVQLCEVKIQDTDPEDALMQSCNNRTRVMSVSSVQYGSGLKLDLKRLGQFCRDNNILFCVDAIQSIGAHHFDVQEINADFAMADAHKWMLGPEGIALFYCRKDMREELDIYQYGWHMIEKPGDYDRKDWEIAKSGKRFECGSPNMLGIYAMSASVSLLLEAGMPNVENEILKRTDFICTELSRCNEITLISNAEPGRHAGIATFKVDNIEHKELHRELLHNGVICAFRFGGIRFSPHFYTPMTKIESAITILKKLIS